MKKFKIFALFILTLSSIYFVFFQFQNCAKVNYQTQAGVTVTTTGTGTSTEKTVEVNPLFFNDPSDVKILFVVDDSFTMSQSRIQLANTMNSMLDPLKGRNSEIRIVSTTGILNNQLDYANEDEFIGPTGPITAAQAGALSDYTIKRNYRPSQSARHQPLIFSKYYTDTQFDEVKEKAKSQVLAVGNAGDDTEETLCAAIHHLYDDSTNSFFKPGDKAAVIFVTDENDASLFTTCSRQIEFKSSNTPQIYYSYDQERIQAVIEYYVMKDNVQTAVTSQLGLPFKHSTSAGLAQCTAADRETLRTELIRQGYQLISINDCIYTTQETFFYGADFGDDGSVSNKDLCTTQVTYQGQTYSTLYAYIASAGFTAAAGSCKKVMSQSNSIFITENRLPVIPMDSEAGRNTDLISGIQDQSEKLFKSGYIIASIVRRPNDGCPLNAGQSVGSMFESLTAKLSNNAVIESLCASSFETTLSSVSKFMVQSAQKSYSLKVLSESEYIRGINIKRGNSKFTLSSHQYETVGHTFTLLSFEPQNGDIFEVLIGQN
jgi:hypothetical protein